METKRNDYEEFMELAGPIIESSEYQQLKNYIQHGAVTTYDHCIDVAWKAFCMNRALHVGADEADLVIACLLHDYYLYDWHTKGDRLHGLHHPSIAAECAKRDYQVKEKVEDAIKAHMWPLTITSIPRSRIAWLLTMADKICSATETVFKRNGEVRDA